MEGKYWKYVNLQKVYVDNNLKEDKKDVSNDYDRKEWNRIRDIERRGGK